MLNCEEKRNTDLRIDDIVMFQKDNFRCYADNRLQRGRVEQETRQEAIANIQETNDGGLDRDTKKQLRSGQDLKYFPGQADTISWWDDYRI